MPSLFPAACDDTAAALSLTLPYIFNIFAPGSRQNTKEEDHSKMIKGKKKNPKMENNNRESVQNRYVKMHGREIQSQREGSDM